MSSEMKKIKGSRTAMAILVVGLFLFSSLALLDFINIKSLLLATSIKFLKFLSIKKNY